MKFKQIITSKIFFLGLLIRLIVMPFASHYDLRGINYAAYQLPYNHVFNIYETIRSGPIDYLVNVNFGREYFIYPPLTYFTLGTSMWLLKPLYGNEFVNWIQGYGSDVVSVLTHPHVFRYLFLMKLPYLAFDVLALFGLYKLVSTTTQHKMVLKYWWLNPVTIFIPYLLGQFDIIPTALSIIALWIMTKRPLQGTFILGVAAAYKMYPFMFLPLILLALAKNWRQGIGMLLAGVTPWLITIIPYIQGSFFRETVLLSPQSQKMLDFSWMIGGDGRIYPFIAGYTLIAFWTYYVARKSRDCITPIVMSLLWYYATTTFHLQWFMWCLPFLVVYAVRLPTFRPVFWWTILLFFARALTSSANVTTELFVWISPAMNDIPTTRYLLGLIYDLNKVKNIINSFYLTTAIWVSIWLAKQRKLA